MIIEEVALRRTWTVANTGLSGGEIVLSGWDFGGDGEIAFLQHANGMCAALWALVATQLTRRFRVIALDARGHGDSQHLIVPSDYAWSAMVDDVISVTEQILTEEGKSQIALGLGSSFGGILLAGAAAQAKDRFARLIMLDPPIHPSEELIDKMGIDYTAPLASKPDMIEQTLKRKYIWDSRESARQAWKDKALFSVWDSRAFDLYLQAGMKDLPDGRVELKCHPTVEAHIFATTGSLGLFDYAPHVDIPVELVHAAKGFFTYDFYRHIAAVFPNCSLSQLQAGHMLPFESPDRVVELVFDTCR